MTKAELETKHLSDLHALAAEAGVEKFRMLTKSELVDQLSDGDGDSGSSSASSSSSSGSRPRSRGGSSRGEGSRERPARRRGRRDGGADEDASERQDEGESPRERRDRSGSRSKADRDSKPQRERERKSERDPDPEREADTSESSRPRRRRRRRPFGRRDKSEVTIQGLLLPPEPGRQAIVYGESREACTALLRSVAADIAADSKGPDPVALLIDPSPEELADWRREAPQAEIVAAGQPRHATDALAQAVRRAGDGEDIFLLVDSLTRLAEASGDAEAAKEFFDAGREQAGAGGGSLTVVAALETSA
jgi:transcription termination factor Rho